MLNTETTQARFALRHPHGGTVLINPLLRTWHQYDRGAALLDHGAWMPHQCTPAEGYAEYWAERGFEPVAVPGSIVPATGPIRVWTGHTDDEGGLPLFASLADVKAYAEREFRASDPDEDFGEITWEERTARTAFLGYPNSWELETEEYGGTGWHVFGVLVHPSLASALEQDRLEQRDRGGDEEPDDEDEPAPPPDDPDVPALFATAGAEAVGGGSGVGDPRGDDRDRAQGAQAARGPAATGGEGVSTISQPQSNRDEQGGDHGRF